MRSILKKLQRHTPLKPEEYLDLMRYAEDLRSKAPQSYEIFYDQYAGCLETDYQTILPRFASGLDDFYDYLLKNPQLLSDLRYHALPADLFPVEFRQYLQSDFSGLIDAGSVFPLLDLCPEEGDPSALSLPSPRNSPVIYKYEDGNPYKEEGLKNHFERIGRYSFVSRLQSYRYLRGKAREDRIEVIDGATLGGIFTNKDKSIYYYVFLTENDLHKAANARRVLNMAIYGIPLED